MTINIGSKITPLDPADTLKIVDLDRVDGIDAVVADVNKQKTDITSQSADIISLKEASKATKAQLANSVSSVALTSDNKLIITQIDATTHTILLPTTPDISNIRSEITALEAKMKTAGIDVVDLQTKYGAVSHRLDTLADAFVWTGEGNPPYLAEASANYWLNLHGNGQQLVSIYMPPATDLTDGTSFFLTNSNTIAAVELQARPSRTIAGLTKLLVAHGTYVHLVLKGTDWIVIFQSDLAKTEHPLTASDISSALDNGVLAGPKNLEAVGQGWFEVPVTDTTITGKPSKSKGDLTIFRQNVTGGVGTSNGLLLAFGSDQHDVPGIWIKYIHSGIWTTWHSTSASPDLSDINSNIALLKSGAAAQVTQLQNLNTSLGAIFAPTKSAFDTEVNSVIQALLVSFKNDLIAAGWGPLTHVPAKNHPLPQGIPKIFAEYGIGFPDHIGDSGQFSSTSGSIVLTRGDKTAKRIFVLVPNDANQADAVTGIKMDGALAAAWPARDMTVDGEPFRIYHTSGSVTEDTNTIIVLFG